MLLVNHKASLQNIVDEDSDEVINIDLILAWVFHISPHNHVTINPNNKKKSLEWVASTYQLSGLPSFLGQFLSTHRFHSLPIDSDMFSIWNGFHFQLLLRFNGNKVMPSQLLQALPPSDAYLHGKCDMVILSILTMKINVLFVAQVHIIFSFHEAKKNLVLISLMEPLLYVELFEVISDLEDVLKMFWL
ncbi:hypothetical protein JVU11DRAFT_11770 [Chiua virens]|nr:hypothetical protein JVU11DRAFT_11770 [Chiua virens]